MVLKRVRDQGDRLVILIVGDLHRSIVGQTVTEIDELTKIGPCGLMKSESNGYTRILGKCSVAHNRILPPNRRLGKMFCVRLAIFVTESSSAESIPR